VLHPPPPEPAGPDGSVVHATGDADDHDGPATVTEAGGGATITPYRDGPLIVRGDFRLVDQDGAEIDPGRRTVALCRCGKSGIKPFCDGTHKRSGFSAPSTPSRPRPAARIAREAGRTDG
jgi:CDGSH-type Zn-finger protein